ncbi:hypothetical protein HMPREF0765_2636 [Sphingobacterium spiritivorum ATCC 33300]|uniref:Uncharacterized protein n=1 Tax=Sphingobacterium spiritivorum ATCC 33300 TaxID=525372 RepID=C2FZ80_SPHSI|nr:hypothetical protein HMPREF0765_2636 [Sphingobacterium spiritivorum ATCC 33300]
MPESEFYIFEQPVQNYKKIYSPIHKMSRNRDILCIGKACSYPSTFQYINY